VAGSCEHGNGPSGPIKGSEFIDHVSDSKFFKIRFNIILPSMSLSYKCCLLQMSHVSHAY
jgi:hypothetical protein